MIRPLSWLTLATLLLASFGPVKAQQTAEALFRQAVEEQQRGDLSSAIRDYRLFLKQAPRSVDGHANLGAALSQSGQFDQAIQEYQLALQEDGANPVIRMNLGLAFYKKGDFAGAADQFRAVYGANKADLRAAILLGDTLNRQGEPDETMKLLEPAEMAQPGNPDLEYVLGTALVKTKRLKSGAELLERSGAASHSPDALFIAGTARLDLNDFERAREDANEALALDPEFPGLHTLAGTVLEKLGEAEAAEAELRKALAANPNDAPANLVLGALLLKQRKTDEARPLISKSVALDPSSLLAHYERALLKIEDGHLESAAAELEDIEKKEPRWLEPHIRLAALYFKLHKPGSGARERKLVDQLTAEQHAAESQK